MIHRIGAACTFAWCVTIALGPSTAQSAGSRHVPPRTTDISYYYDLADNSVFRPITRVTDPALGIRKLMRHPRQALNVDEHDQVRLPSTWWQPRLGYRTVTPQQIKTGPGPGTGPAGRWKVTRAKTQGVTPGFFIKDQAGESFIIKFDPPRQSEMATAADVVASHLFWAAGYNVPDNSIVRFQREDLDIATDGTFTDELGRKQPLTQEVLDRVLSRVAQNVDGSYRGMASRLLKGKPLGPFEYRGRRTDDPEDLVPHEHRRELRGMWPICAWVNHADCRGPNSLDLWVTAGGRSFVRHHLIDFGSCLGSAAVAARSPQTGSEYFVDYGVIARSLLTLGLARSGWEETVDPELPSIGFIEGFDFDPGSWRPDYPNPAFDERTTRDIVWGTRIVAAFTEEHIRAAVELAHYTDPRATEYLVQVLIQRRNLLMSRWLSTTPTATAPFEP